MRAVLIPLTIFALSFGLEEAVVVLYLRRVMFPSGFSTQTWTAMHGVPSSILLLERTREYSTIVTLIVVAWLCSRVTPLRLRAFLFSFGLWDIAYYAWLYVLSGYPTLTSTDVLFLLPVPWVAPVWAALTFALAFVACGAFGLQPRRAWMFIAGLVLGFASFVAQAFGAAHGYPLWLFLPSIALIFSALMLPGTLSRLLLKA